MCLYFFSKSQVGTYMSDLKFSSPTCINFIACTSDLFWHSTSDMYSNNLSNFRTEMTETTMYLVCKQVNCNVCACIFLVNHRQVQTRPSWNFQVLNVYTSLLVHQTFFGTPRVICTVITWTIFGLKWLKQQCIWCVNK